MNLKNELRILVLEDNPLDYELIEHELKKAGLNIRTKRVETKNDFLQELKSLSHDIILLDYMLPDFDGISALDLAKKKCPDIPVIFVTGFLGEEIAVDILKRGATDYVLKNRLYRLAPVVKRVLHENEEMIARKNAETKLREDERFIADIFSSIQDSIGVIDKDMNIVHTNHTAQKWYSHAMPLVGKKCYEAYHGRSERCEVCPAWRTLETGESAYEILTKHGKEGKEVGWLENFTFPMIDSTTGETKGIIEYVRDITERKQIEKILHEKEKLLSETQHIAHIGSWSVDLIEKNLQWSDEMYNIYGVKKEEFSPTLELFLKLIHPDDKLLMEKWVEQGISNLKPKELDFRIVLPDGNIRYIRGQGGLITDPEGKPERMVGTAQDITERERVEESLKLFSEAVENAVDGVQITNLDGRIIYSNKAIEEIYGFSPEEYQGKHVNEMNVDPLFASNVIIPAIKENGRWNGELLVRHKNGREVPIWLNASIVINGKGDPIAMMGIIRDIKERKEAEKKLEASRAFLQSIIDGVVEPIMVIGVDHHIILMNRAARMFSLNEPFEYGSLLCHQISHHCDVPCSESQHPCPLEKVRISGEPAAVVHEHHTQDGKIRFVEILASPLFGADGDFQGIIESSRDITERRLMEEALRESEERYRRLIEFAPDGITAHDLDALIFANTAVAKLLGAENPEQLIGRKIQDIIHPDHWKTVKDRLEMEKKGIAVPLMESKWLRLDGKPVDVEVAAIPYMHKRKTEVVSVVRDITERKRIEKALIESEIKYRTLFESAGDSIFILDTEGENAGRIIAANRAASDIHGYSIEELLNMKITDLDTPDAFEKAHFLIHSILKGERIETEITHRKRDGTIFPVEINASLIELGNHKYILAFDRDITERKRAGEAIQKYARALEESNRMKELFIDIMHHDLLNPLNIANGYVEIIKDDEEDPRKKTYLETIERNLVKGMELIDIATRFSRLESLERIEMDEMDLRMVIDEVIRNLYPMVAKAGMMIENNICLSMPVRANNIIEDVFSNIISNAVKYARDGKRIVLESNDNDGAWKIKVMDFGEGINDEDKPRIFERFHRMEKKGVKGSGLGLAIARKIMELHHGKIWIEDNPEGGAVFVVEIPKKYEYKL